MPIPVSDKFKTAQAADANLPVSKAQLVFGNYASFPAYASTVAASSTFSADYPASGAIDGDRTEINVGPASGADNDIGKSSWQSSVAPDTTPQTLAVTFLQARIINRVKLYSRFGHGCKTYALQWWDGATWQTFAATADIVAPGQVSITPTYMLDTVDFPDLTTTQVRIVVSHTQVAAENAQIVELEIYRLVDITDRVTAVSVTRSRDYKLSNPMATSITLTCSNVDRFFSLNHTPTVAELSAGFVNAELDANIGVIISLGFNYFGPAPETPNVFVGYVDRIQATPINRSAVIDARDGTKTLINRIDSTKLKTGQDIAANIRYLLNRSDVSNYEMALDTSGINIDFFFTDAQNILTSIRDLVEASADAAFYFDEMGIATYKFYAGNVPLSKLFTSQADWLSGTLMDIDANVVPGDIFFDFTDTNSRQPTTYGNSLSGWTTNTGGGGALWTDNLGTNLEFRAVGAGGQGTASRSLSTGSGRWEISVREQNGSAAAYFLMFQVPSLGIANHNNSGYAVWVNGSGSFIALVKLTLGNTPSINTNLASISHPPLSSGVPHTFTITKDPFGRMRVLLDGSLILSATDTTYPTGSFFVIYVDQSFAFESMFFGDLAIYTPASSAFGVWVSPPIDTGANTSSYTTVLDTHVLNGGTVDYQTRSSADGLSWNAYMNLGGGNSITSPVLRFLQVKATLTSSSLASNANPDVLDITVSWVGAATSQKYPSPPSSFTFSFDSTLLNVAQELADNLGGDSSIINDVTVQAQPLVLTGADSDTVWQGTIGTPPQNVSGVDPISVTTGQVLTFAPIVSGGMDVSFMTGVDPAAAVVTFGGGATGSWAFTSIYPTVPVLTITITNSGLITDLRIVGKTFASAPYLEAQVAKDAASISKYGDRQLSISNQWIVSSAVASFIAAIILANFKSPTAYIPTCTVRPTFSMQIGDRVTISDINLDLTADYITVGVVHTFSASTTAGDVHTDLILLKVPIGN